MVETFTLSFDGTEEQPGYANSGSHQQPHFESGPERQKRRRRPFRKLLLGLILIALICVGWGLYRYSRISSIDVPGVEPAATGKTANWLFVGTDTRQELDPNEQGAKEFSNQRVIGERADTIMVVRVDSGTGEVNMLSIPRDLWVPLVQIDGSVGDVGRINGSFNAETGGQQRLVATIEHNLGIEINHYAEVNFVGFQELVNAIGGVELCVDAPMRDPMSGLSIDTAGCHVLDGAEGLAFVRSRNVEEFINGEWVLDPTADFGRTARQRMFLSQVAKSAAGKLGPTSVLTIDELASVAGDHLLIEDGAGPTDLARLARNFSSASEDQVIGHALPVEDYRTSGGAAVLRLKEAEAQPTLDIFRQ